MKKLRILNVFFNQDIKGNRVTTNSSRMNDPLIGYEPKVAIYIL